MPFQRTRGSPRARALRKFGDWGFACDLTCSLPKYFGGFSGYMKFKRKLESQQV